MRLRDADRISPGPGGRRLPSPADPASLRHPASPPGRSSWRRSSPDANMTQGSSKLTSNILRSQTIFNLIAQLLLHIYISIFDSRNAKNLH